MKKFQDPTVTPASRPGSPDATREDHPCYALIGASRVSGYTTLFQSDFKHTHYMTIRVYPAHVDRHLNRDWVHAVGLKPYIEVALSEAQWATFVSTPNGGMGVPCTLDYFNGQDIPIFPEPKDRTKQFNDEVKDDAKEALAALETLKQTILDLNISEKSRKTLLSQLWQCSRKLDDSIPHVAKAFAEHMENIKEQAKTEIHAHAMAYINGLGMQALAEKIGSPIQLDAPSTKNFPDPDEDFGGI